MRLLHTRKNALEVREEPGTALHCTVASSQQSTILLTSFRIITPCKQQKGRRPCGVSYETDTVGTPLGHTTWANYLGEPLGTAPSKYWSRRPSEAGHTVCCYNTVRDLKRLDLARARKPLNCAAPGNSNTAHGYNSCQAKLSCLSHQATATPLRVLSYQPNTFCSTRSSQVYRSSPCLPQRSSTLSTNPKMALDLTTDSGSTSPRLHLHKVTPSLRSTGAYLLLNNAEQAGRETKDLQDRPIYAAVELCLVPLVV